MAKNTPEGKVKGSVKKHLRFAKAYTFAPVQTGYGKSTLDFLACVPTPKSCPQCGHTEKFGQFVAIETKAEGKKMTNRQRVIAKMMKEAGAVVYLVKGKVWTAL
jgi:hypothetical protein